MYEVSPETLKKAHKPFDIVTKEGGDVGVIQEVNVNDCQEGFDAQISYSVNWVVGNESKHAWFDHEELTVHANVFTIIAESACHPFGNNRHYVKKVLFAGES